MVVDFWAEWCPACTRISGSLTELAEEFGERIVMAKLNADDNPAAVRAYRIMSLPALLVFREGEVVGSIVGARPKTQLHQALIAYAGQ